MSAFSKAARAELAALGRAVIVRTTTVSPPEMIACCCRKISPPALRWLSITTVLRRIDPATGTVDSHGGLAPLAGMTDVWTTALADGRVLIAGNTSRGHRLAVLDVQVSARGAFALRVVGSLDRSGTLAMGPAVTATRVNVALVSGASIAPEEVALTSLGVR